ncbi:MAG TPA: AI-2E family transporter, partial [Arthrobacter bacterium]|nr:AI-2E family transporter [Arthrobacter sp.]
MTPAEDATPSFSTPTGTAPDTARSVETVRPARVWTDRELDQDIPYGIRIAASWAWRLGLILLMAGALIWLLGRISFLIIPVMVAALLGGLLSPVVRWLRSRSLPNGAAVAITVVGFIGVIVGALALVGRQLASGFGELWSQALTGVEQVQDWLADGPLHLTADQIDQYLKEASTALQDNSSSILSGA